MHYNLWLNIEVGNMLKYIPIIILGLGFILGVGFAQLVGETIIDNTIIPNKITTLLPALDTGSYIAIPLENFRYDDSLKYNDTHKFGLVNFTFSMQSSGIGLPTSIYLILEKGEKGLLPIGLFTAETWDYIRKLG